MVGQTIDRTSQMSRHFWEQNKINGFIRNKLIDLLIQRNFNIEISTLGPTGTSSENAANHFLNLLAIRNKNIYLRETFEESMQDVYNKKSDLFIVANAYKKIDRFYMYPKNFLYSSFICDTPDYGLACLDDNTCLNDHDTIDIITHPAPVSLIPWFLNSKKITYKIHVSSSTSKAAESVANKDFLFCVTNRIAAQKHNLSFISRTKPINMLWSVFGVT